MNDLIKQQRMSNFKVVNALAKKADETATGLYKNGQNLPVRMLHC
jgi:hypothetical protein